MKSYEEYLVHNSNDRGANVFNRYADEKKVEDEKKYESQISQMARDKRANFEYMKQAYDDKISSKIPSQAELQ